MRQITKILALSAFVSILFLWSCVDKKFDAPTTCADVNYKPTHTIEELKELYQNDTLKIKDDIIIEGVVTSSDQYGNFYKELVIQDSTDALSISIDASFLYTRFPLGQKIYVKCKDLYLGKLANVVRLGDIYTENGIVKFGRIQGNVIIDEHLINSCNNEPVEPERISLDQVGSKYTYKLVTLENVQFKSYEVGETWADVENLQSVNHNIIDQNNNSLFVRTSGYAKFARDTVPAGNGSITGVLSFYNKDYQLIVRSLDDVAMNGKRFTEDVLKDFEDENLLSGGWTIQTLKGVSWNLGTHGGKRYLNCSNYNTDTHVNTETETWFISPELNLNECENPNLVFENTCNYNGDLLIVRYSVDYDGMADPTTATWTDLSPTLSTGGWSWVGSGDLALPKEAKYVAFVYVGSSSSGKTWEVDNIFIGNKK